MSSVKIFVLKHTQLTTVTMSRKVHVRVLGMSVSSARARQMPRDFGRESKDQLRTPL